MTMTIPKVTSLPEAGFTRDEEYVENVMDLYSGFVNPGLASLMKFGGFGDVEVYTEGCYVHTALGRRFLDFLGGYGVFTLGHRHPRVLAAVRSQLDQIPLSTRTFFSEPVARLAARLSKLAPGDLNYTFFCNSGTEAAEGAIKMARAASGKTQFVATIGAFHGKSMGGLSATGREIFRKPFEPMVPGFIHVLFNDASAIDAAINDDTAGVIIEPIQGEGGIIVPSDHYLADVRRICTEKGVLLILDEVQTGLARTGAMFACEHYGVAPDLMMLAKALGGGIMPIGAVMGTAAIWERVFGQNPLIHTSTFGGNPLACSAGLATLDVIEDEGLVDAARLRGNQLLAGLQETVNRLPNAVKEARGMGLLVGVEFFLKDVAELTINGMSRRGVIAAYTLNNPKVIRFEPPAIVTAQQVDFAINAFAEAVAEAVEMLEGCSEG